MTISKVRCDECGYERDAQEIGGGCMIRVALHWGNVTAFGGRAITSAQSTVKDFCDENCLLKYLTKHKP